VIMPLFSDEVRQRCKLGDLVAEEIATLPEIEGCLIDDIPILESISVIPVDGGDGCDGIDGYDAQDGYDGVDGRDGLDAMDGYDAQDAADGADGRDGCDAIDGFDAQDGTDGADGRDGLDAIDGFDAQDGTDGVDGRDGLDAIDGFDAQDAADGVDGRDGLDAIDGFDAQDAADGADGRDGCDAIDGFDAQDAADGADGRDGCDGLDGHDAQDGTDGVDGRDSTGLCIRATNATGRNLPFGSAVGVSVSSLPKPPIDPPPGIGLEALLIEAERFHYFEDRSYHVVLPGKNTTLGITTEPIDAGDTGCIALSGIVRAVVNVRDTSHDSVTFTDGTTLLESTDSGDTEQPGQLSFLIRPTTTGRQWCDLVFGVGGGACGGGGEIKLGHLPKILYVGDGGGQGQNEGWQQLPVVGDGTIPDTGEPVKIHPYFKDSEGNHVWSPEITEDVHFSFRPKGFVFNPGMVLYGMSETTKRNECIKALEAGYLEVFEGWYDTGGMFRINATLSQGTWPVYRPLTRAAGGVTYSLINFASRMTVNTAMLCRNDNYLEENIQVNTSIYSWPPSSTFNGFVGSLPGVKRVVPVHLEQIEDNQTGVATGNPSVAYNSSTGQVAIRKATAEQFATQRVWMYRAYDGNYSTSTSPKGMTDNFTREITFAKGVDEDTGEEVEQPFFIELGDLPGVITVAATQNVELGKSGVHAVITSGLVTVNCLPIPERNNTNHIEGSPEIPPNPGDPGDGGTPEVKARPAYVRIDLPSGKYPPGTKVPLKIADDLSYLQGDNSQDGRNKRNDLFAKSRLSELRIFFFWTSAYNTGEGATPVKWKDTAHNFLGQQRLWVGCIPYHFKEFYHPVITEKARDEKTGEEIDAIVKDGRVIYLEMPARTTTHPSTARGRFHLSLRVYGLFDATWLLIQSDSPQAYPTMTDFGVYEVEAS